jgi:hypothetical protein
MSFRWPGGVSNNTGGRRMGSELAEGWRTQFRLGGFGGSKASLISGIVASIRGAM